MYLYHYLVSVSLSIGNLYLYNISPYLGHYSSVSLSLYLSPFLSLYHISISIPIASFTEPDRYSLVTQTLKKSNELFISIQYPIHIANWINDILIWGRGFPPALHWLINLEPPT